MLLFFFQSLLIYASTRHGGVAEWSCSGLQLRVRRFDSDLSLQLSPGGEIGRHKGFKIPRSFERAGSSPAPGTII